MRPILWGIILFLIGAVGWVFSVVLAVITLGTFKFLTYVFGVLLAASLPVTIIFELVRWLRKKK
ncbi:MAG: hypothetical protein AAB897_04285 [Patescibacteria group bacterium]